MSNVEICESVASEYIPGWGESNKALLENAKEDLDDATVLLIKV